MATMKNRPVSFNIDNLEDQKRLAHVEGIKNFSGYVKSLIDKDMQKNNISKTPGGGIVIKGGAAIKQ